MSSFLMGLADSSAPGSCFAVEIWNPAAESVQPAGWNGGRLMRAGTDRHQALRRRAGWPDAAGWPIRHDRACRLAGLQACGFSGEPALCLAVVAGAGF